MSRDILATLDAERRAMGEPAGRGGVVREYAADGSQCRIVFSRLAPEEVDEVIRAEQALARDGGYALEWKVYGHDTPTPLAERLLAAGFEADDPELVLVLPVTQATMAAFGAPEAEVEAEVRRVRDEAGLVDYAEIAREIGRRNPDEEKQQLAAILRAEPESMSVHVAYVDGEPAACGRIHFRAGGDCAELAGGRTKTTHRKRGLFTAVVAARLAEAYERGRTLVFTDALPTSEPLLRKRGFQVVTSTQPFVYEPAA
ncbi:hypothetical protein P3T36_006674 [Kitasatospora sp. MAP12-15]|uniref:GNAT family N-acetyltransferase n=1 Tax=unclassified Kitasatospora TaxID=2633591 RepID=UPI002474E0C4|nr:GNAT family N-acetyltransferase [Kitasatospora sp. MAP12-44]MDH6115264.1 hypothetical protein [Kitasatospora sp. MAP12-44]